MGNDSTTAFRTREQLRGIQAARDTLVSEIARSLQEDILAKKTQERLEHHLQADGLDDKIHGSGCLDCSWRRSYNARMKWMLHSFWALAPMLLLARPPVPAALPPVVHADTETVTNVPFTASLDAAGRFRLSLACLATPSNNVEAAFGVDRDGDGVLALEETDCVVGWDCGAWFVRKGADGARTEHAGTVPADGVSELSWSVQTSTGGAATRLEAAVDGAPAFAELGAREPHRHELAAGWLYRREWNMAKLTGRGLEGHGEAFSVQVLPDAVVIRFR